MGLDSVSYPVPQQLYGKETAQITQICLQQLQMRANDIWLSDQSHFLVSHDPLKPVLQRGWFSQYVKLHPLLLLFEVEVKPVL